MSRVAGEREPREAGAGRSVGLAVGASVLLATGLALLRVLPAPATRLAGGETVDSYGTWWFQWWVARVVHHRDSLSHTDLLFFPWGKDVLAHTGSNVLDALLLAPFQPLLGSAGAWNALAAAILVTNGLAAAAWGRRHGPAVAAAAAVLGVLAPFPLHELAMGRPTQAILAPLLGALLLGGDALREGGTRRILAAGALLALQGWFYWYAAGFGALALVVLAAGRPFGPRLARLLAIGGVSFALTAPVVVPLYGAVTDGTVPGLLPVGAWIAGERTLASAEGAAVQLGILGRWGDAGFMGSRGFDVEGPTLGLVPFALVLLAPGGWRIFGLLALVLALGPFPWGHANPVYLGLAAAVPPVARLYWPVRALALVLPAAAVGLVRVLGAVPPRLRAGAAALAVALIAGESVARGTLPLPTWSAEVGPPWRCLAAAEGAVVVLPYGQDQAPLVYQTVHGRPMLNGMHERSASLVPEEQQAFRHDNTWMSAVLRAPVDPRGDLGWTDADKQAVYDLGYRFVALRVSSVLVPGGLGDPKMRLKQAKRRLDSLAGAPVYADEDVIVWAPWGGWPRCPTPGAP